jgi:serine/threonine-protein kinase RsbT
MPILTSERLPITVETDVVLVRQAVRKASVAQKFSLVEQTKLITAASEIARNTLDYGGGGEALIEVLREAPRTGVRVTFIDQGPGIPDIEQALRDGFTTGGGLGHGLGGAKRLVDDFTITSVVGSGTTISITRWK